MMSSLCTNHPNIPKKYWWGTPAQLQMWGWVFAKPRVIISFDSRLWTRRKGCSSRNSHHFQQGHLSNLLSKDAHPHQPPAPRTSFHPEQQEVSCECLLCMHSATHDKWQHKKFFCLFVMSSLNHRINWLPFKNTLLPLPTKPRCTWMKMWQN